MKLKGIGVMALGVLMVASCGDGVDQSVDPRIESIREPIVGPSTLGGRNEVVMLFARTVSGTRTCSGGYSVGR